MRILGLAIAALCLLPAARAQDPAPEEADGAAPVLEETSAPEIDLKLGAENAEPPAPETLPPRDEEALESEPLADDLIDAIGAEMGQIGDDGETAGGQAREQAGEDSPLWYVGKWMISLCVVIAAILLIGAFVRRFGKNTPLLAGGQLGKVLGRVYLERGVSLHFVQVSGRVLVVGVANGAISLIAEFDEAGFTQSEDGGIEAGPASSAFWQELQSGRSRFDPDAEAPAVDDELGQLRQEVRRLQEYVKEDANEYAD